MCVCVKRLVVSNLEKTEGGLVFDKLWKVLLEEEPWIHLMRLQEAKP